jgi:hypothetical protein
MIKRFSIGTPRGSKINIKKGICQNIIVTKTDTKYAWYCPVHVQRMHMSLVNSKLFYTVHRTNYWLHLNSLWPHKGICHNNWLIQTRRYISVSWGRLQSVMVFPSRLITSQIRFDALGFPNVALEGNVDLFFAENNFLLNGLIKNRIGK